MTRSILISGAIIAALCAQLAFAVPDTKTYQGNNAELKGVTIADDNAKPPHRLRDIERRQGAPTQITSNDGKYTLGATCDQDTSISSYFLFGSDFQDNAQQICDAALAWADSKGSQANLMPVGTPAFSGQVDIKARHKIAATIWHIGKQRIVAGVTNFGMDSTAAAKTEAMGLCTDAVNYIGNICVDGIFGTNGAPLHPKFQWEALRDGSVVWSDLSGKKMLQITFTEENA